MLDEFEESSEVEEVIIIDNARKARPSLKHSKIRFLEFGRNIYVNPAWNVGVAEAKGEYVCLISDDVLFDVDVLRQVNGMRGFAGPVGVIPNESDEILASTVTLIGSGLMPMGWGTVMMGRWKDYRPIPIDLLIYFGDEWLFKETQAQLAIGLKVCTREHTTSKNMEVHGVGRRDFEVFNQVERLRHTDIGDWKSERMQDYIPLIERIERWSI